MYTRGFKSARALLLVVCMGSVLPVWSQSTSSGTLAGSVTDPSNAVVPGATVALTDSSTNIARTTSTNKEGRYIFVDVTPGVYSISVTKSGFATSKTEKHEVKVGESLTLNLSLQVGGANVVVEVSATGTELQTMNATVGNTVTALAIDNLPSIGRDVNTFIELQPGVSAGGDVAGAVNDQSYFSLDGGNNSNDMDGSGGVYTAGQQNLVIGDPTGGMSTQSFTFSAPSGVLPTPADSVEEFKVNTAGQTADFNSSAGAEIQIVTKRGTSSFHGTAYEYYKDNNWSSNAWANNQNNWEGVAQCGAPNCGHIGLPSYHYSRFGGAIGGPVTNKEILGGKTFFFYNYEGFRYPNSETITRNVPSPALRLGLLTNAATGTIAYNLNNAPVVFNGVTYAANYGCAGAPGGKCDPLGLGLNPLVSQIWNKYEPQSNSTCAGGQYLCDNANVLGFAANLSVPITSNFDVARIDHDFGSKNHFMTSWRYYKMNLASDSQIDIGGFFPGDTLGTPASQAGNPIRDWYLVAGLTTNITTNTTNDIHYSYLRNWWAWSRAGAPPQIPGLGGALELDGGQQETQDLGPFNVNNGDIRRRFWDGHDNMFRDDISMLKGNHLFQFGGTYQHNWDYHQRNDSGGTINAFPVYELGNTTNGSGMGALAYPCATTSTISTTPKTCDSLYANVLGVLSIASQMFARSGASLTLDPPLSNAFDQSTIPYYNVYFSDTWHMKPTLTFTYGLGWALEMPPVEANGKQAVLVDAANQPVTTLGYLANIKTAALQGNVYNPEVGFALVGNASNGLKYPYNPFYGEFSPRVAVAWNPRFDGDSIGGKLFGHDSTVVRGGYGRVYGRTNGVVQVLVPLLGLGLEQPVACNSNLASVGSPGNWACGASLAGTYSNGFRVGSTVSSTGGPTVPLVSNVSTTLPQPAYPGFNNTFSSNPEGLDPNFRANAIDSFDFTIQRQISRRVTLEVGYIGRRITHEYQPVELNPVPYMMTLGGQQFKQAYANLVTQYCGGLKGLAAGGCAGASTTGPTPVTPQPFFETALKGTGYCNGFTSCTAAVASNEGAAYGAGCTPSAACPAVNIATGNLNNAQVWGIWSDLDSGVGCPTGGCTVLPGVGNVGGFAFPRSLQSTPIPATCAALGQGGLGNNGCTGSYTDGAFLNASIGYGNYNAGFVSLKMADWRGLTLQNNFTWSKALGVGAQAQSSSVLTALDPFNLQEQYGRQAWDRKFIYNVFLVYQPPFFKGQSGFIGRALGGWTFATIFAAGSGVPTQVGTTYSDYQGFGACDGIGCGDYDMENAVPIGSVPNRHAYYCPGNTYSGFCSTQTNGFPVNYFPNGVLQASNWRNPILGIDNRDGGSGILGGLAYWNMDFSIKKSIRVAEGISLEFQGVFANVLNHNQWTDNYLGLYNTAGFGALGFNTAPDNGIGVNGEAEPRNIQLGARVRF
ncbi:MAG: carboxypeptidase-like regulatory domain-containing protein [Candidatus Sulfotelmatobacter sp.]